MTDTETIIRLCREAGVDQHGLASARNFLKAAFYHCELEGTLPADKHVAINSAIRFASGRLSCGGRHGYPWAICRFMSRGADAERARILADNAIKPAAKIHEWKKRVTFEHGDPVSEIESWMCNTERKITVTVDQVILRLLETPPAIILRTEERLIQGRYRKAGSIQQRYAGTGIEIVAVEKPSSEYFRTSPPVKRTGKYDVERLDFSDD